MENTIYFVFVNFLFCDSFLCHLTQNFMQRVSNVVLFHLINQALFIGNLCDFTQ